MQITKLLLLENFSWLIGQLKAFDDPSITYVRQGLPNVRGGERRIFRDKQHYDLYYKNSSIRKTPPVVPVKFGSTVIECDKWSVSHDTFEDPQLKEKFPAPKAPYSVLVTSQNSLLNRTAKRYYVSCSCMDFDTTFKQELINYGYTNDDGSLAPATGGKKLAPAICKHIYAVLMREYSSIISQLEPSAEQSAEIQYAGPSVGQPVVKPTFDQKVKEEARKNIVKSLSFISNRMSSSVDAYKNTRAVMAPTYKKFKFMLKRYPQGFVIVFTNPSLNPFRDKNRDKEIVPIFNWERRDAPPLGSPTHYYSHFTKDELLQLIRNTRSIQPNQIEMLNKSVKKYSLTENLDVSEESDTSILMEIFNVHS